MNASPWARYEPTPDDPWDLRKVAHLHRRAGFGATRAELLSDLEAGPEASVDRLFRPTPLPPEEAEAIDGLRQTARSSSNLDLLKVCWLNRILQGPDPLREKLTLFWHGHFATSNKKVESVALMDRQNETLRTHALGGFAALLEAIVADPAMLVWLDGGTSKKNKPNENFAREFLELFTLGTGHYSERDVREAARAFTGWVRQDSRGGFLETPVFTREPAQVDDGPKTFLGKSGRWGPSDIVRISARVAPRPRPFCAQALPALRQRVRAPGPELIEPLAEEIQRNQFAIGPIVGVILRSRHFYSRAAYRQRIKSPVEFERRACPDARGARAGAQPTGTLGRLRRAGPGVVRPAERRGLGRRLDLDQQRYAAGAHQLGRRRRLGPRRERPDALRPPGLGRALQAARRPCSRGAPRSPAPGRRRRRGAPRLRSRPAATAAPTRLRTRKPRIPTASLRSNCPEIPDSL